VGVCLGVFLALTAALLAQQLDRERTETNSRRAAERLQTLQQEADRLAAQERTLLGDLRKLEIEREMRSETLRDATARAADVARELAATDGEIERLEQEEDTSRPELRARLVELYKLGQGRYLRLLLSVSDVRDLARASRLVAELARSDRDRVEAHERRLKDLKDARARLESREQDLSSLRAQAESARAEVDRAVATRNQLIGDIDRQRDLNAQLSGELQGAQQKLQLALRDMAAGANAGAAPLPLGPFQGDLEWPVPGTVRQRFGAASAPGRPPSSGIEIAAMEGAAVHAIHDGTVAFTGPFTGFGNLVIVQHDPQSFSLYGNLADISVAKGAHVETGATVGTSGASVLGAPGLYFELRIDGRPVDPLQWLKGR
jgi:septal ring factor EnvC (AmiA/AmiB activator)